MKYFETHAHYNDEKFDNDLTETLEKIKNTGVKFVVNVGYNFNSSKDSIELANKYDNFYAAIGIHPHDVGDASAKDIEMLYKQNSKKIVAIGEIGLDYAFVKDNKEAQAELFIEQIELANKLKLPVIIHSRDASFDTYKILKENKPLYGALLHCFQPSEDLVRLVLDNGYMVAFGGNITYKRKDKFDEYVNMIPIEQIVIETDSPYLAPVPLRGTRNDSSNLPIICKKLAEYKKMDEIEVAEKTYQNAIKFFRIKSSC